MTNFIFHTAFIASAIGECCDTLCGFIAVHPPPPSLPFACINGGQSGCQTYNCDVNVTDQSPICPVSVLRRSERSWVYPVCTTAAVPTEQPHVLLTLNNLCAPASGEIWNCNQWLTNRGGEFLRDADTIFCHMIWGNPSMKFRVAAQ